MMMTTPLDTHALSEFAAALVAVHAGHPAHAWLSRSLGQLRTLELPADTPLRVAMARSGRMLGGVQLPAGTLEAPLPLPLSPFPSEAWRLVDLGRAALVREAFEGASATQVADCYAKLLRSGGLSEQESLLRALPLLPHGEGLVDAAIEASRTNATPVFAALALDNPFPAARFPALNFNQLVLKAVFLGLPVARIHGLAARATDELARMVHSYASERAAAHRSVPAGVEQVLALAQQRAKAI